MIKWFSSLDDFAKALFILLFALMICLITCIIGAETDRVQREAKFNNGICPNCHVEYKFVQAVGNDNVTYLFECEKCGKRVAILRWPDRPTQEETHE